MNCPGDYYTLYTVQTVEAYNELMSNGILTCSFSHSTPEFNGAYLWLMNEMSKRLPEYDKDQYPIWAYLYPRPDMRSYRFGHEEDLYLLTLKVQKNRVLITDYDAWHAVLNGWFWSVSEAENNYFDNVYEHIEDRFYTNYWKYDTTKEDWFQYKNNELAPMLQYLIEDSWYRSVFFPFSQEGDNIWNSNPYIDKYPVIQATFAEIKIADVYKVEIYKPRKK